MPTPIKWILGILIPVVLTLCLLSFGNPQCGKWVYLWQVNVFSLHKTVGEGFNKVLAPPDDFNGLWKTWITTESYEQSFNSIFGVGISLRSQQYLTFFTNYEAGSHFGEIFVVYYENGSKALVMQDTFFTAYDENGKITYVLDMVNGALKMIYDASKGR